MASNKKASGKTQTAADAVLHNMMRIVSNRLRSLPIARI